MIRVFEDDLDDYPDVLLITAMLIGTSEDNTMEHAIRIQKMAFLADKIIAQPDLDEEFDFGPDKFGPMSENVESSVGNLIEWGYATPAGKDGKGAKLTEEGMDLVKAAAEKYPGIHRLCEYLNGKMSDLSIKELIKTVYRLYPKDTVNSLIRDEMVKTNKMDSLSIDLSKSGRFEVRSENGTVYPVEIEDGVVRIEVDGSYA